MTSRNIYLDICRCICNYTIVLLHADAAAQYCSPDSIDFPFWTFICGYICPAALPVLFFISGYFTFYNYDNKKYPSKLKKRFKRLAVPYLCWNVLFIVLYLSFANLFPRIADRVVALGLTSFSGIFSKILSFTVHPIDGPLWFMRTLFVYSVMSPLLWLFVRNRTGNIIGMVILIIFSGFNIMPDLFSNSQWRYPLYSLFAFLIGGIVAKIRILDLQRKTILILTVIGGGMLIGIDTVPKFIAGTNITSLVSTLATLIKMGVVFGLISFLPTGKIYAAKITQYLISTSFFVYTGHILIGSAVLHLSVHYFAGMFDFKYTVLVLLFCILGIFTLCLLYNIFHKWCPKLLSLFDGTF